MYGVYVIACKQKFFFGFEGFELIKKISFLKYEGDWNDLEKHNLFTETNMDKIL